MKLCLLLTCFLFIGTIYAQESDTATIEMQRTQINPEEIHVNPEEPASFQGGKNLLDSYLYSNLRYPQQMLDEEIEGLCYVKFVIDENGKPLNPVVIRRVIDCPECDMEALRLINEMPNWIPAKNGGKPVKSYNVLQVSFALWRYEERSKAPVEQD